VGVFVNYVIARTSGDNTVPGRLPRWANDRIKARQKPRSSIKDIFICDVSHSMEATIFLVNLLAIAAALALALPAAIVWFEVWLALAGRSCRELNHKSGVNNSIDGNIAVLIPAHNEESVIGQTLATLVPTLPSGTRLVVVADNCNDQTAAIARHWEAQVVERQEVTNRGKGFALKAGLEHLAADPPAAVVFLDADCRVAPQTVSLLASAVLACGRPVQGLNLCPAEADAPWQQHLSSFAEPDSVPRAVSVGWTVPPDGDGDGPALGAGPQRAVAGQPPCRGHAVGDRPGDCRPASHVRRSRRGN
jgi:hypothetical protein